MGGYRVAASTDDPLAIDEALCRKQRFQQRLFVHALITVVSMGLWLPGLLVWLVTSSARMREFAQGYAVRIRGGQLLTGNAVESRSVPLDAIADVTLRQGFVTVAVRGAQPLSLFGVRDPQAAASAILDAREKHIRGIRAEIREEVLESAAGVDVAGGRAAR